MINHIYRLVAPGRFEDAILELEMKDKYIYIKPTYLSICAADSRYFFGNRKPEVLKNKLPMALIHEGVGEVMFDPKGKIKQGKKVVMIPNTPIEKTENIKENYLKTSKFKSSGIDGFMQSIVEMERERIIVLDDDTDMKIASLIELLSVSINAVTIHNQRCINIKKTFGVWGEGNLGMVTCIVLKKLYPKSKIILFGKNSDNFVYFPFVSKTYNVDQVPKKVNVDQAFECVGGQFAGDAIAQIIKHINPQGTISLMGVSEEPPNIETRMILEKGLTIIGHSRSSYEDFKMAVELLKENDVREYLGNIISDVIEVKNIEDIIEAFEKDKINTFKTVMKWKIL